MPKEPVTPNAPEEGWRMSLLGQDATMQQAIRNLDESALQISLVVSPAGVLLGTLTDGDIRRGLLRGMDLDSSIEPIIQRSPFVVPPSLGRGAVRQIMQTNKIHQLPVVDEDRRVVGLHLWDSLLAPDQRSNIVVLMAGGLGTRLRPRTDDCPKPLLPVNGRPMLEHVIERAKAEGFRRFILALHYLGNLIEDHFGDGSRWEVEIDYLREESPLGTAGALELLSPRPNEAFLVANGDVLTDVRYGELLDFHRRNGATATMAVREYEWQIPFGVVHTEGVDLVGFEEKPVVRRRINAGVYVLDPGALDVLNSGESCDMPALFSRLKANSARTIVFPMYESWLDVGSEDDYASAQRETSDGST